MFNEARITFRESSHTSEGNLQMYRKSVVPALVVGALFTLSACGSSGGGSATGADGVKTGPGVTASSIKVGLLTDYSGPIAEAATAGSQGGEVYFDKVNAEGGVCGRKIVAVKGDTKYDAQQTTQAYRAMSKDVLMISQVVGTASINAIKDSVKRDNMPMMAISLNTTTLALPNVYVPLPTFEVELINGLAWAAQQAKATPANPLKVGMVNSSDEFGQAYSDALKFAAKQTPGVEIVASPTIASTDKDFTAPVSALKKAGAQVVMVGVAVPQTAGVVGTAAQLGYTPTWVANSGSWYAALAAPLKGLLGKFYVSDGYASLVDKEIPGIQDLEAALTKYAPGNKPNNFQVGGWLFGEATVDALKQACANKDLTREGVMKALKDLKIDYQGITPAVDMGNGDEVVSFSSRVNKLGAAGELIPVSDFAASDAATAWGQAEAAK